MKVKELIAQLRVIDPERIVILSSDGEGNSYAPLTMVQLGTYIEGDVGIDPSDLTEAARAKGWSEDDLLPDADPCLVLYP